MPTVFYTFYDSEGLSIPEVNAFEHELGRKLLSLGLGKLYSLSMSPESLEQLLLMDAAGKPSLPDHPEIHFNITHCPGLAACAFHDGPIGIDAELPGYFAEVLTGKALTASEKEFLDMQSSSPSLRDEWFYRFWTLKEAYVKMTGSGVDTDLKAFSFSFKEGDSKDKLTVTCSEPEILCFQKVLWSGHVISMCIRNDRPCFTEIYHIVL